MPVRHSSADDLAIRVLHPGPGADFRFASPPALTPIERLAQIEREMLDGAIERHIDGTGRLADLAVRITVLRAEIGQ